MADKVDASVQTDPVIITSCRKRSNESNDNVGLIKKALKTVVLKMLIPNLTVGAILGKKGEDIVSAQKTTGAVAKLSKLGEFYPGTNERICLISGEAGSIIDFCSFIVERIINETQERQDAPNIYKKPQVKLLVSNAAAGVIIGKNGAYVQEIKEKSGVFIQLSQKVEGNAVSERCVILGGSKDQLNVAIVKIVGAISQDSAFNSLSILNYFSTNSPKQTLYPPQPPWPNSVQVDNYQEHYSIVSMSESPSISYPVDPNATFTTSYEPKFRQISQKIERVEKSIEVPESIIGHILGKGGVAITELKSHTLTDIKISKKGVYVPNTMNRSVTISGNVGNVDYAMRIISKSVQNEERRRQVTEKGKHDM